MPTNLWWSIHLADFYVNGGAIQPGCSGISPLRKFVKFQHWKWLYLHNLIAFFFLTSSQSGWMFAQSITGIVLGNVVNESHSNPLCFTRGAQTVQFQQSHIENGWRRHDKPNEIQRSLLFGNNQKRTIHNCRP